MKPASFEKRAQIIEAKLRGEKTDAIMLWVKVSKSTIDKVWRRYRVTGSGAARAYTGRRSSMPIGVSRLSQVLIKWGYSFKKRRFIRRHNDESSMNLGMTRLYGRGMTNERVNNLLLKQFLAPTLRIGNIVIMDNLSSHKVAGVLQSIYDAGAQVLFLPPYSPDFNPIEMSWSKMKSIVRELNRVYMKNSLKC